MLQYCCCLIQGSHRSKNIKFKDFSRTFKDLLTHIQGPKCAKNICFKINVCLIMLLIMLNSPVTFRLIVRLSRAVNTLCFKSVILVWLHLSVSQQQENSRTFKNFYCFSRTFQAWNFIFQIQGLSRIFKDRGNPVNCYIDCMGNVYENQSSEG